ncbi:MAG: DUF3299 domain-containing protein [Myxococcota bacterium]
MVGFAGLGLALLGAFFRDFIPHEPAAAPPIAVRGRPLEAMGGTPPAGAPISDESFAMAARFDGVVKRRNGRLSLERTEDGAYLRVPMSLLSGFAYDPKPHPPGAAALGIPAPQEPVPDEILALDGKTVALVGFMVPLDVDRGGVKTFVLSQNRSYCCYGIKPALNEMVLVQMGEGRRAPFLKDTPIAVLGKLAVSEQREGGVVLSLYRLEANTVTTLRAYAQSGD